MTLHREPVQVGFDVNIGGTTQEEQVRNSFDPFARTSFLTQYPQGVGAEAIIDAVVTNTPVFLRTSKASRGKLSGSIVLNNVKLLNVPIAVGVQGGETTLNGGSITIQSWGQGNVFKGTNSKGKFTQGAISNFNKPACLLDESGNIFGKSHPQYENYAVGQFVSVKDQGAKGDGRTDDTDALQAVLAKVCGTSFGL